MNKIILGDDDASLRLVLSQALSQEGYGVRATGSLQALAKMVRDGEGELVLSDVYMGDDCLFDVLPGLRAARPDLPIIVMSGQNNVLTAVSAAGSGAYDYVPKPFDLEDLLDAVKRALQRGPDAKARAQQVAAQREERLPLIGRSKAMQEVYRVVARAATSDMTVLVQGEIGAGKEATARAIHQFSRRKNAPFVRLSLHGSSPQLALDALYSAEGAAARADGGTLFIDDVDRLSPEEQSVLAEFLNEHASTNRRDLRLIASTTNPLHAMTLNGGFRPELYYRLAIVTIVLPPLRERPEDVGDLARAFLLRARREGLPEKNIDASAVELLKTHSWPGNVRELENLLRRISALRPEPMLTAREIADELAVVRDGAVSAESGAATLDEAVRPFLTSMVASAMTSGAPEGAVYDQMLEAVERPLIEIALKATRGNQVRAAAMLGINRNTLRKKIQMLGMSAALDD